MGSGGRAYSNSIAVAPRRNLEQPDPTRHTSARLPNLDVLYKGSGSHSVIRASLPRALSGQRGRRGYLFSDNVLLIAQKPL
jgi:hypothetical protein